MGWFTDWEIVSCSPWCLEPNCGQSFTKCIDFLHQKQMSPSLRHYPRWYLWHSLQRGLWLPLAIDLWEFPTELCDWNELSLDPSLKKFCLHTHGLKFSVVLVFLHQYLISEHLVHYKKSGGSRRTKRRRKRERRDRHLFLTPFCIHWNTTKTLFQYYLVLTFHERH